MRIFLALILLLSFLPAIHPVMADDWVNNVTKYEDNLSRTALFSWEKPSFPQNLEAGAIRVEPHLATLNTPCLERLDSLVAMIDARITREAANLPPPRFARLGYGGTLARDALSGAALAASGRIAYRYLAYSGWRGYHYWSNRGGALVRATLLGAAAGFFAGTFANDSDEKAVARPLLELGAWREIGSKAHALRDLLKEARMVSEGKWGSGLELTAYLAEQRANGELLGKDWTVRRLANAIARRERSGELCGQDVFEPKGKIMRSLREWGAQEPVSAPVSFVGGARSRARPVASGGAR